MGRSHYKIYEPDQAHFMHLPMTIKRSKSHAAKQILEFLQAEN